MQHSRNIFTNQLRTMCGQQMFHFHNPGNKGKKSFSCVTSKIKKIKEKIKFPIITGIMSSHIYRKDIMTNTRKK